MNPRSFINFFRTPAGRIVRFLLAGALLIAIVYGCRQRTAVAFKSDTPALSKFLPQSFTRKVVPLQAAPTSPPAAAPVPVPTGKPGVPVPLPAISLYAALASENSETETPQLYAPYGRLIPCVLIVTVDSAQISTPIIGLVTEEVWHAGRLVIPAGTEVHGRAQLDRSRERIASQGQWTLVWFDGRELTVSGLALDQEKAPEGNSWDVRDGSAGLRGELLRADNLAELKLFASKALAAFGDTVQDRQQTPYGTQPWPTVKNAALAGAGGVLDLYAQRISESLARDGIYVRVPAGKTFYLYVTETIDLAKARVASTQRRPDTRLDSMPPELRAAAAGPAISTVAPLYHKTIKP